MTVPGRLLATGRDADVFAVGPDRVVRRYRDRGRSAESEAEVMRFARSHGYPVPRVDDADGPDLLMERLHGPTMLEDVGRRPWTMWRHAETLARLHRRLHELRAPAGLRRPFGDGGALLHLDLHPANVVLSPAGPVVIDWTSAAAGPAAADPAQTWILLATSDIPGSRVDRAVLGLGRRIFVHAVVRRFTEPDVASMLPRVAEARRADPNVRDAERVAIDRLLARHGAPTA